MISARLFRRTKELESQVDKFFDQLSEAAVIYRLAVRGYLRAGVSEEFNARLEHVCAKETEADSLRRQIEHALYTNLLIPDSRGDVLGLIETADEILSLFKSSLWAFEVETPEIHKDLNAGYRRLTNMVVKSVDELAAGCRVFFRSPHLVSSYNAKVTLYEKEADKISYALKKQIFSSELGLAEKIHLREFVDHIDAIADQAEDVADRLTIYAVKRQS
ncbi:DUF47 family protein [Paracoccaceae bacterium]|jgi:hypothetical protein|nr:DUF47 family protein [Paracoccaceae bacterium]MDB0012215.1 DUF47 family protein [Paracoccaceae bacterium]